MKTQLKKLIKFYYGADGVNAALDGVVRLIALSSWRDAYGGEHAFEEAGRIVGIKAELSALWADLDGVMGGLSAGDALVLEKYSKGRPSEYYGDPDGCRALRRALMKFKRRLGNIPLRHTAACAFLCENAFALLP